VARLPQVEVLTPSHPSLWAGIVALRVKGSDHGELADAMAREDGIVVGRVQHGAVFDALRVSLHASNETGDIDRLLLAMQRRL
jgi:selenocysteine lyase/cysteine desulfurase